MFCVNVKSLWEKRGKKNHLIFNNHRSKTIFNKRKSSKRLSYEKIYLVFNLILALYFIASFHPLVLWKIWWLWVRYILHFWTRSMWYLLVFKSKSKICVVFFFSFVCCFIFFTEKVTIWTPPLLLANYQYTFAILQVKVNHWTTHCLG